MDADVSFHAGLLGSHGVVLKPSNEAFESDGFIHHPQEHLSRREREVQHLKDKNHELSEVP